MRGAGTGARRGRRAVAELVGGELVVRLRAPLRGVAPGQTLVLYCADPDGDEVLGSATIAASSS